MHCREDIVTLLSFHQFARAYVRLLHIDFEYKRDYTVICIFIKLGKHVNHDERINPIDFGSQRSNVNTVDKYGNNFENMKEGVWRLLIHDLLSRGMV